MEFFGSGIEHKTYNSKTYNPEIKIKATSLTLEELSHKDIVRPDKELLAYENNARLDKIIGMKAIRYGWKKSRLTDVYAAIFGRCPMEPDCSKYGYLAISEHGLFMGALKAFARVMRCNPLGWRSLPIKNNKFYHPVTQKKNKNHSASSQNI